MFEAARAGVAGRWGETGQHTGKGVGRGGGREKPGHKTEGCGGCRRDASSTPAPCSLVLQSELPAGVQSWESPKLSAT